MKVKCQLCSPSYVQSGTSCHSSSPTMHDQQGEVSLAFLTKSLALVQNAPRKNLPKKSTPNYVGKKTHVHVILLNSIRQSNNFVFFYNKKKKVKKPSNLLDSHQNTNFKPCVYVSYDTFDFTIQQNTIRTIRICLSYDS